MDAALLTAGISAALAAAGMVGGRSSGSKPKGRQARKAQSRRPVSSGLGGYNPTNVADTRVKPPNYLNVPKRIPRNVASLVAWDSVKINLSNTFSGTSILEANYGFSLSQHPQAGSWTTLFDQWSIPQVTVEWDSTTPPGATTASPMLYTALDFDSAGLIGTIARIEDFSTSEAHPMNPQHRFMRSVRPCTKGSVQSGSGSTLSAVNGPTWVDSGDTTIQFFGIRSIYGIGIGSVNITQTIWFCFRNQI